MSFLNQHLFEVATLAPIVPTWQVIELPVTATWTSVSGAKGVNNEDLFVILSTEGYIAYIDPLDLNSLTVIQNQAMIELYGTTGGYAWKSIAYGLLEYQTEGLPSYLCVREHYPTSTEAPNGVGVQNNETVGFMPGGYYRFASYDSITRRFVGLGSNITDAFVCISYDLSTWDTVTLPAALNFTDLIFNNGIYIAIGHSTDTLLTSPDGYNWTAVTLPMYGNYYAAAITSGFVNVFQYGNNTYLRCPIGELDITTSWQIMDMGFPSSPELPGNWMTASSVGDTVLVFGYSHPTGPAISYDQGETFQRLTDTDVGMNTGHPFTNSKGIGSHVLALGTSYSPNYQVLLGSFQ